MQTLNITLTESGKYKHTKLPKGETKGGNIVYEVINIPDELNNTQIMAWLNQVSLARVNNYVIDYNLNRWRR